MLSKLTNVPVMLLLAGLFAAPACATQTYGYRGSRDYGYGRELEQRAYNNGFHEGQEAGQSDGRRGRAFSFNRHDEWRDADEGYRRDFGDREFYRRNFRRGFEAGYSEAFNRYGYRDRGRDYSPWWR